ncbi:MAG: GTPase ObgE, partial [Planctomycetota bacterium]
MFNDEATISIRSGNGGPGCVSFRREKFIPEGGPDGGDGGRGGDVIALASLHVGSLSAFARKRRWKARNGQPGGSRKCSGAQGEDLILQVPLGTVIRHAETEEILADLTEPEQRVVLAAGGRGGGGNCRYKSATNQTPRKAGAGEPGVAMDIRLELKLIADIGLVGLPNAGKSTLISRLSAARPKIADYPFTTLEPQLGVLEDDARPVVLADIPGLIAGAADGVGLGHRFLRHVERVAVLAFLVCPGPEEGRDPVSDYHVLLRELGQYSPALLEKPRVLVLSKMDLPDAAAVEDDVRALAESEGCPFFAVSSVRGDGLSALTYALQEQVDADRGRARVTIGGLQVDAKIKDLTRADAPPEQQGQGFSRKRYLAGGPTKSVSGELEIIGMRVEPAMDAVDAYLDKAVLSHHDEVRIAHGYGIFWYQQIREKG